jgi:hypothetical protein
LLRIGPDFRRKQALAIQYDSARPSTFLAMKQEDRLRAQLRAQTAASSKPSLVHRHRPHVGPRGACCRRRAIDLDNVGAELREDVRGERAQDRRGQVRRTPDNGRLLDRDQSSRIRSEALR